MPTKQNKIKYKLRKTNLSDSDILKYKDFGKLMTNYQKATRPLTKFPLYKYKNRNIFLVVLIILLLLWLLFNEANEQDSEENIEIKTEKIDI